MRKEIEPYASIDRQDNKVTRENYIAKAGKAYGFFDCSASKEAIEAELPAIRIELKTPNELELSLIEGMDNIRGDKRLTDLAQEAKQDGMRYVMEATYPGATNERTSGELQALLINTSNLLFCRTNEHIRGKVVYEEKGEYVFRE